MLRLRVDRGRPFIDALEADRVAREVGAAARRATRLGKLWTYSGDDTVVLDDARMGDAAKRARFAVSIVAIPGTPQCGVFVCGSVGSGRAPVRLTLDLARHAFVEDAESLLRMLTEVIMAMEPDRAALGARSLVDAGDAWAAFAAQRPERPVGARVIPLPRRGAIILAFDDPRADDEAARTAAQGVRETLARSRTRPPSVEETRPTEPSDAVLDGTVELRDAVLGPALPFVSGASSGATSSIPVERHLVRAATGTEDVDVAKIRESLLPFLGARAAAQRGGAAGLAEISLETYALLRATLAIHGEDDVATLAQFGIRSLDEKRAVQARFATIFRADPAAQERFVTLVKRLVDSLPRSGVPKGVIAEPDLDATAELQERGATASRSPFNSTTPLADSAPGSRKRQP